MADIFVKPYDQQRKSPVRLVVTAAVVLVVTAVVMWVWIGMENRPAAAPVEETVPPESVPQPAGPVDSAPSAPAPTPAPPAPAPLPGGSSQAGQLFARAQSLAAAGHLEQARSLLDQVIAGATEENLRNNALRVQGRINLQLFLSNTPMAEKTTYLIQPGDSLDKIARQNKTTVELIRKMNQIENNLIYPGGRLLLPAAPFVVQVDKSAKTLDLTLNGKIFKRYVVGLGVNGKTPTGRFATVVHQTNPDWTPPGGGIIPFGDPRNILGTRWMSIQDATRPEIKGFGIHGTPLRDSIGADTSNGCVRMLNEDVEELYLLIPRGTDVVISD
jgi:lipoprotein-anchoring transpeptidase ErfK/SrfK